MVRYPILHYFSQLVSTFCRAILHDPATYPEPDSFRPERFINPDGSLRDDPVVTSLFGFGKRICPGRHLADAVIFIAVASLLSVFNIEKGNSTDEGPDAYPFTGDGTRYGFLISLTARKTRRADRWHLPP
jgi:cytochrome P450